MIQPYLNYLYIIDTILTDTIAIQYMYSYCIIEDVMKGHFMNNLVV